eukprot:TRINITY_DN10688_c0_g1_i2.p1 TRINITY_DN10688_c0_g1~~TRINITY_DN10688_c0_g1_i2.p1  ORF type:complete len:241 (+),score=35.37 TRINITY_DN10688_c0_g1_i2:73-723(+)
MECCFVFLRRRAGSHVPSKLQSPDRSPPKERERAAGLLGEGSSLSASKDRKGLPTDAIQSQQFSGLGKMLKESRIFRFQRFAVGSERKCTLSQTVSIASTRASPVDVHIDDDEDGRKRFDASKGQACSHLDSSSEEESSGSSLHYEDTCNDKHVTLFRRWTDPQLPNSVRIGKPEVSVVDGKYYDSSTAAGQEWFDPLLMGPSRRQRGPGSSLTCE